MTELVASLGNTLGLRHLWSSFRQKIQQRQQFKQTVRELSRLSDYELADLGIHRSEIPRVAREALYDDRLH